jgi:hypothetical protein
LPDKSGLPEKYTACPKSREDNPLDSDNYLVDMMRALSPHGRWKDWLFMALHCYLDESESKGAQDPAMCVAGYIAQGKKWARFAKDWNKVLDRAPKRVEVFHATDYAGKRKSKNGNFHGWTERQRESFISELIATVKTHRLIECGVAIHRSTYKQVMTGKRGHLHGDLELITGKLAMMNVAAWGMAYGWKRAPSFFVESGSRYYEALRLAHRQLKQIPEFKDFFSLSGFSEVPKSRAYPQTQPADMLAFYATRWIGRLVGYDPGVESEASYMARVKPNPPSELMRLLPGKRHFVDYHTPKTLDHALSVLEGKAKLKPSPPESD